MASTIAQRNAGERPLRRLTLPSRPKTTVAQSPSREQYTVAWIAALPIELASAMVMLDTVFEAPEDLSQPGSDSNAYTYGSIRKHNVVIASLPVGSHYTVAAATTTQSLITTFPNVRFGLLVGIGGAIPKPDQDIRLGDVAIGGDGVFQHDHGKKEKDDRWVSKSDLAKPPDVLTKALSKLLALHEQAKTGYLQILNAAMEENQDWAEGYKYPVGAKDRLFQSSYNHAGNPSDCSECDQGKEIQRNERRSKNPHLHNGIIASGNTVVKDALVRDAIGSQRSDCICLEMEAAGLMGNLPFLVIRGICDYSDSHKNNTWQRYASATAAVVAKELLKWVPPSRFAVQSLLEEHNETPETIFLNSLGSCDYTSQKNENREAEDGTCVWFTNHHRANHWWYSAAPYEFLWLTLERARGKSVLVRHLVDTVLSNPCSLCYFFFRNELGPRGDLAAAMRAILTQLFIQKPVVLRDLLQKYELQREVIDASFSKLWEIFLLAIEQDDVGRVVCLFDAFDDCQHQERQEFLERIAALHKKPIGKKTWVKIILTSRPTEPVRFALHFLESKLDDQHKRHSQHLPGDDEGESKLIQKEVKVVVRARVSYICETQGLSSEDRDFLLEQLYRLPMSTYLWVDRLLNSIETEGGFSRERVQSKIARYFDEAFRNRPLHISLRPSTYSPPRKPAFI